jgi:hypothetical protein
MVEASFISMGGPDDDSVAADIEDFIPDVVPVGAKD